MELRTTTLCKSQVVRMLYATAQVGTESGMKGLGWQMAMLKNIYVPELVLIQDWFLGPYPEACRSTAEKNTY